MYVIEIQTSDGSSATGNLQDGAYRIGSSPSCHIQLDGQGISPEHCMLYIRGDRAKVADLNSENGTFLDGTPLSREPVEIRAGQQIAAGDILILLKGCGEEETLVPEENRSEAESSGEDPSGEVTQENSYLQDEEKREDIYSVSAGEDRRDTS